MRNIIVSFVVILSIFGFVGCKHEMPNEPAVAVTNSSPISMSNLNKVLASTDTINVVYQTNVILRASSSVAIANWNWAFPDSSHQADSIIVYKFSGSTGSLASVKLTGITATGSSYSIIRWFRVVSSVSGYDVSVKAVSAGGGLYTVTMLLRKEPMNMFQGSMYYWKGDPTIWANRVLVVADTNVNEDGTNNSVNWAPYIRVQFTNIPGLISLGVGKLVSGQERWGTFYSPYSTETMISFVLNSDGTISPKSGGTTTGLPGYLGDVGDTAIVRFTPQIDKLLIYVNNGQAFSNFIGPFVRIKNEISGAYGVVIPQYQVSGYANWGMATLNYSDIPEGSTVSFNLGTDSSQPTSFISTSRSGKSQFFNQNYGIFRVQVVKIVTNGVVSVKILPITS